MDPTKDIDKMMYPDKLKMADPTKGVLARDADYQIQGPRHVRNYAPIRVERVAKASRYASGMVCSQETMLEHLRYVRHQLDREERALQRIQDQLLNHQRPRE